MSIGTSTSLKDFGEDIHFFFDIFSNTDSKTDAITARWLALAPKSAYAHLARANHYRGIAITARGEETIDKVKPADMRRMSESIDRAIPLLREAISRTEIDACLRLAVRPRHARLEA